MHLRVSGQWVLFPLGPKCTIRFCRGAPAPLRQSVHVGTPQSLARHTIYRTHVPTYQYCGELSEAQAPHTSCTHWCIRHLLDFINPLSADFANNCNWYITGTDYNINGYKHLTRVFYFYNCTKRCNTVWNDMTPTYGIMVLWFLMMSWYHSSWYHGITVPWL